MHCHRNSHYSCLTLGVHSKNYLSHDLAGRLTGVSDTSTAVMAVAPPALKATYATSFGYDALNRPTGVAWDPARRSDPGRRQRHVQPRLQQGGPVWKVVSDRNSVSSTNQTSTCMRLVRSPFHCDPKAELTLPRRDPEIAEYDRRFRKEEEIGDIQAFINAYPRATAEVLEFEEIGESPDALCRRPDGRIVGVEHTRIRRSPKAANFEAIHYYRDEMDPGDTFEEICRMIMQKAAVRPMFSTADTILMIAVYESDFDLAAAMAREIPLEDLVASGFQEIWLVDFKGIREGAHREVRLFGLYPEHWRITTPRSMFDQKPYG
jgi:hypothetical protein